MVFFCAYLHYSGKNTAVWQISNSTPRRKVKLLWEMPGWFRNVSLTNDGLNLIVAPDGGNLLEQDLKADRVIFTFFHNGKKVRDIALSELISNPKSLEKTESNYHWCQSFGLDNRGRYSVTLLDNRQMFFDPATGLLIH